MYMCQYQSNLNRYYESVIKKLWTTVYILSGIMAVMVLALIGLGIYGIKRIDEYKEIIECLKEIIALNS